MTGRITRIMLATAAVATMASAAVAQQLPDAIAAKSEAIALQVHAEGAQIYECKAAANGKLTWQFREPIATLFQDGKTLGRHYAGPTWELTDGSVVVGKVTGRAPGNSPDDIPMLKLDVTAHRGTGVLSTVTAIQRIDTQGGTVEGPCDEEGEFQSEPYAAEYVFLRKAP